MCRANTRCVSAVDPRTTRRDGGFPWQGTGLLKSDQVQPVYQRLEKIFQHY